MEGISQVLAIGCLRSVSLCPGWAPAICPLCKMRRRSGAWQCVGMTHLQNRYSTGCCATHRNQGTRGSLTSRMHIPWKVGVLMTGPFCQGLLGREVPCLWHDLGYPRLPGPVSRLTPAVSSAVSGGRLFCPSSLTVSLPAGAVLPPQALFSVLKLSPQCGSVGFRLPWILTST